VKKHLLNFLLAAGLTAGCASHDKSPLEEGANPQPLPTRSFAREWATSLQGAGADPVTAIYVRDQFIFAYRRGGTSTVMDRATGQLLHIDPPRDGAERLHPPVVLKDRIVYPTTTYLEVFDFAGRYIPHATKTTDELDKPFSQSFPFPIRSDAVGAGKLVFFGVDYAAGGRVLEVDMTRPYAPEIWPLMEPGSRVPAAPAVVKDAVFVAAENGSVASVAIESREPFWTLPQGVFGTYDGIVANLAADQTGLYVASTDTKLYALNRSNGKVKWEYFAQTPLRTGPVLTRDAVYIHVPGTGLVALDKTEIPTSQKPSFNRNPLWAIADATQFLSEDDHYAYVRIANQIAAVDKKTGQREFTSKRNDLVAFGTNIKGDGVIFVATKGARIIAVKAVLQPGQVGELVLQPVPEQGLAMAR
jgi:hypothetical protein